eukprot:256680-Prymnesium_polylepis.1
MRGATHATVGGLGAAGDGCGDDRVLLGPLVSLRITCKGGSIGVVVELRQHVCGIGGGLVPAGRVHGA